MLRGLSNISFYADDVDAAGHWYTDILGIAPYFRRDNPDGTPGYIEFRVGDFQHELGIVDRKYAIPGTSKSESITFWHVDDLAGSLEKLLAAGATLHDEIRARGEGFDTASVVDPFGNVLGIMSNPHYLEMLGRA
ncbi:VOC family protein [Rhodococcoides fascians]|uniref:VOC family protein n=1 Tax=Rhodococcoides fascians TaxID=1828 RepID=UPI00036AD321|nr:VOC family protein [Rhodococcus fascians]